MGLVSNVDLRLSPAERKQKQKDEWQDHVIQSAIAETPDLGPGSTGKPSARISMATHAQLADTEGFRVEKRAALAPTIRIDPDTQTISEKRYTKAEYDALMAGWYCRNCDNLQEERVPPEPSVMVPAYASKRCMIRGKLTSCGYPRVGRVMNQTWSVTHF